MDFESLSLFAATAVEMRRGTTPMTRALLPADRSDSCERRRPLRTQLESGETAWTDADDGLEQRDRVFVADRDREHERGQENLRGRETANRAVSTYPVAQDRNRTHGSIGSSSGIVTFTIRVDAGREGSRWRRTADFDFK